MTAKLKSGPDYTAMDFSSLLTHAIQAARAQRALAAAWEKLASLDGYREAAQTLPSLTHHQRQLLTEGGALPVVPYRKEDAEVGGLWRLGIWADGNVALWPAAEESGKPVTAVQNAVDIVVPAVLGEQIERLRQQAVEEQTELLRNTEPAITRIGIARVLETAREAANHVEPFVLFVNDQIYGTFGPVNNLLSADGKDRPGMLFTELKERGYQSWSLNEKTLVIGLYLLARAGYRAEEFSGRQFTLATISVWLTGHRTSYARVASRDQGDAGRDLIATADECYSLKAALRPTHFVYRLVNGITLNKTSFLGTRADISLSPHRIPGTLTAFTEAALGVTVAHHMSIDTYMRAVVDVIAGISSDTARAKVLERFLEVLITTASEELRSDYGLSRTPKSLYRWSRLFMARRFEEICELPATEYVTAVYAHPGFEERLSADPLALHRTLSSVAARMAYNSWHYAPGQCPPERVPKGRHFYYPPRMSDTGNLIQHHHAGHRVAGVAKSIRSPASLVIGGAKLHGIIDLRFVRTGGPDYVYQELVRAREYTAYIRGFYQAIAEIGANSDEDLLTIHAYTKEWYAQRYAKQSAG